MDKIAVLIPCYNEEKTIAKVVADAKAALPEAVIYVYNNNSSDRTAELAAQAGAVVRNEYLQGTVSDIYIYYHDNMLGKAPGLWDFRCLLRRAVVFLCDPPETVPGGAWILFCCCHMFRRVARLRYRCLIL